MNLDGKTLLSRFTNVECQVVICDFHTWECPVFVLDGRLQSDPKKCQSEIHNFQLEYKGSLANPHRISSQVINLTTGHILPQFHVVFDDTFGTVPYMCDQTVPSYWA